MRNLILAILIILSGQRISAFAQTENSVSKSCELTYDSALNRSYYTTVDKIPTFIGGQKELFETINKNLRWPGGRCDFEGTVFVVCIIEANGQLTNKKILKGLNNSGACNIDREALKVVDFLTSWTPGQCDGKNVAVRHVIPVKFKMTED